MKINKSRYIALAISLFAIFLLGACSKTEFLPEPEGAKIPFQSDATQTVEELLAASPAKLFYSAWQKSNIKDVLNATTSKQIFTVFVPNDAAMQAAGLGASQIGQKSVAELADLMKFYITLGPVAPEELKTRTDNFMVKSMLVNPQLFLPFYEGGLGNGQRADPYHYRNYMIVREDQLLINGKNVGKLNYQPATNGGIYVIEKAIEIPTKTILEALEADGRFTMFLEAQRMGDDLFIDKIATDMEPLFGYKPSPDEIVQYAYERNYYKNNWTINENALGGPNIVISTLFAPTDEAFHKAGFMSVADVISFNERSLDGIRFDENLFTVVGGFPLDTVFNFHRDFGRMLRPATQGGDRAISNATVFYSNVLSSSLNDYLVSAGGNPTIEYAFKMPLDFTKNGNAVQLKVKGSEYPAANVIEGDINTLNGPIHVVDHLLFPKGFKLK
ncbi:fasciclin domain-containing protein [Pedobacter xixiisoli]|uniref:Fasciclin domain-containing protein n=1 Tax=Pedobacter xixiisoli TaxID=1476464 RepID=A0A285ZUL4_9SPHI|nr:fasciclin domain-containing protein [Pedobacter xixiisoli]SOD13347.1 Fasciclin domain-containing protein [Pedobacter xixiisoli]